MGRKAGKVNRKTKTGVYSVKSLRIYRGRDRCNAENKTGKCVESFDSNP